MLAPAPSVADRVEISCRRDRAVTLHRLMLCARTLPGDVRQVDRASIAHALGFERRF
jgi:hypothetical protein